MEKLKRINWVQLTLIALGMRCIYDANVAQALVIACFSGIYAYSKYLEMTKQQDIAADLRKEIDDVRTNVSSLMVRNAAKPEQMQQQIKRFF